jgi:hypothetical protein
VRRSIRGEKRVKGAGEFEFDSRTYHVRYILTETDDGGIEGIIVLRDDKRVGLAQSPRSDAGLLSPQAE